MPIEAIITLSTMYIGYNIIMPILVLVCEDLHKVRFMLPQDLKKITTMNWFGCFVISLLAFIIFPLLYLYRLFEFLFHI